MFRDDLLEKIFSDKEMQKIPIGTQATAISVIERILEQVKEGNPYASLSDILSADE